MGVYIKGMKLPEMCLVCPMLRGVWCMAETRNHRMLTEAELYSATRPKWCPLTEVKVPHGRLIDGDKVVEGINAEIHTYWNEAGGGFYLAEDAVRYLKYEDAIIEGEE